jgi:uncharacterized integral membrane protein (TIGR00698 family)
MRAPTLTPSLAHHAHLWLTQHVPGIAFATLIGLGAWGLQYLEVWLIGQAVLDALVLALILGMLWRNLIGVSFPYRSGITFTGKYVLEGAVVLLGASIDLPALLKAGPTLLLAIMVVVSVGISASTLIGRGLRLPAKVATLVAVGSSICGNSAMAALAPVIDATAEDIASAMAWTAVLGVLAVLVLPLLIPVLGLNFYQYGVLAGMTIYAVPQVLAATVPVSAISGQIGTLVKLVRVLLLGPVIVIFSLTHHTAGSVRRLTFGRLVPWFIVGFVGLAAMRSIELLPPMLAEALREVSRWLPVVAMAALGLEVQLQAVCRVGATVAATVVLSLLVLVLLSVLMMRGFGIG